MRIDQITFTRFLAAISIVIFHYGLSIAPFSFNEVSFLFKQANIGVSYFFILSGFVMIIAYGNKDKINIKEYLLNRFARIYPVYLLAILLVLLYVLIYSFKINYSELVLNILVIQSWVPGKALSFNGPGWSLSVELLFYILFPFMYNYIFKRFSYKKLIVPVLVLWLISQLLLHIGVNSTAYTQASIGLKLHDLLYYFPLMHLNEFLIGTITGLYFINNWSNKYLSTDWFLFFLVCIFFLILKFNRNIIFHNGMMMIVFVPLIFLISINKGIVTKLFKNKIAVFLGEASYGIYILQKPIYLWSSRLFEKINIKTPNLKFYIYFLILLLISSLSYLFIETPCRNIIKKLTKRTI